LIETTGDRTALRLLRETLDDASNDLMDRLRALEILDGCGFRQVARTVIDELRDHPEPDDYWIGDQLLRQGRKVEALAAFEQAISSSPDGYEYQISGRLAELGAVDLLQRLSTEWRPRHDAAPPGGSDA
jgi:tetratricopeptide (TPR) repeat protein